LKGQNVKELRASAWAWAESHGIIGHEFHNDDTNAEIEVVKASLRHAFDNYGVVNVLLIPLLPELLKTAVLVATVPHEPFSPEIKAVHRYFAACCMGGKLYRVKFTVKERQDGHRLYDHQSAEIVEEKKVELGGDKSPAGRSDEGKLPTPAPSSGSDSGRGSQIQRMISSFLDPRRNWTQDPDVLDTWFSSWLWPFATMGWPEKTSTLKAFYPTTDLVTGPDIIFFWVARMIMAGFEWMGELPFKNVYFTGIIRDKQGRKMSKSLGNSPDPLELIASYSADALRFGIMRSAPLGQDICFDEKNVELGRNFCTKLWNAARFRQMQRLRRGRDRDQRRAAQQRRQMDPPAPQHRHRRSQHRAGRIPLQRRHRHALPLLLERVLRLVYRGQQSRAARAAMRSAKPTPSPSSTSCSGHTLRLVPSLHALHHRRAVAWHGLQRRPSRQPRRQEHHVRPLAETARCGRTRPLRHPSRRRKDRERQVQGRESWSWTEEHLQHQQAVRFVLKPASGAA
jgi:hypothetical protein